jgi:hypothetical protein
LSKSSARSTRPVYWSTYTVPCGLADRSSGARF